MAMDIRKIKKLIELLEESNLAELEIREGEETVRLCVGIEHIDDLRADLDAALAQA